MPEWMRQVTLNKGPEARREKGVSRLWPSVANLGHLLNGRGWRQGCKQSPSEPVGPGSRRAWDRLFSSLLGKGSGVTTSLGTEKHPNARQETVGGPGRSAPRLSHFGLLLLGEGGGRFFYSLVLVQGKGVACSSDQSPQPQGKRVSARPASLPSTAKSRGCHDRIRRKPFLLPGQHRGLQEGQYRPRWASLWKGCMCWGREGEKAAPPPQAGSSNTAVKHVPKCLVQVGSVIPMGHDGKLRHLQVWGEGGR